jgi:hypothetical protein
MRESRLWRRRLDLSWILAFAGMTQLVPYTNPCRVRLLETSHIVMAGLVPRLSGWLNCRAEEAPAC